MEQDMQTAWSLVWSKLLDQPIEIGLMLGECSGHVVVLFFKSFLLIQKSGYSRIKIWINLEIYFFFNEMVNFSIVLCFFCAYILKKDRPLAKKVWDLLWPERNRVNRSIPSRDFWLKPIKNHRLSWNVEFSSKLYPQSSRIRCTVYLKPTVDRPHRRRWRFAQRKRHIKWLWDLYGLNGFIWGTYGKMLYQCGLYWDWIGLKGFMMWITCIG